MIRFRDSTACYFAMGKAVADVASVKRKRKKERGGNSKI